ARYGLDQERALGAEHRRRDALDRRARAEHRPDDARRREGAAVSHRRRRGRLALQLGGRRAVANQHDAVSSAGRSERPEVPSYAWRTEISSRSHGSRSSSSTLHEPSARLRTPTASTTGSGTCSPTSSGTTACSSRRTTRATGSSAATTRGRTATVSTSPCFRLYR